MNRDNILDQIILAFRELIGERYDFDVLSARTDLPDSFDEEKVERFKSYFLNSIYPDPVKRRELNEAFDQLEDYTKQPKKLLRILMESAIVVLKYGRSLPKILTAGLSALRSFRAATKFEKKLVDAAISLGITEDINKAEMKQLLQSLEYSEIENFMTHTEALFNTLHDRTLVQKIKSIVQTLVTKMKAKPALFSAEEIEGLEIGKDIIIEGDALFQELTEADQQRIFSFIIDYERAFFKELHNMKSIS
jgi:hypothetical protein